MAWNLNTGAFQGDNAGDWKLNTGADQEDGASVFGVVGSITGSGALVVSGYNVLTATNVVAEITGGGSMSAAAPTVLTALPVVAEITGSGEVQASGVIKSNWQTDVFKTPTRVVAAGNDAIWYEDI